MRDISGLSIARRGPFFIDFSSKRKKQYGKRDRYRKAVPAIEQPAAEDEEISDQALVYRPEELQALKQTKFDAPVPADPLAAAIYGEFLDPKPPFA